MRDFALVSAGWALGFGYQSLLDREFGMAAIMAFAVLLNLLIAQTE